MPLRERKCVYRNLEAYIDHLKTHGIEYCQSCDVKCGTKEKFKTHKKYGKHKDAKRTKYRCWTCEAPFERRGGLFQHQSSLCCPVACTFHNCPSTFGDRFAMMYHLRIEHPPKEPEPGPTYFAVRNF